MSYILGSGLSRSLGEWFGLTFLACVLSLYLDEVDSHLLLSWWAGWLGLLRHGADIGQTQLHLSLLRRESRAAVLPSSSGAARQRPHVGYSIQSDGRTTYVSRTDGGT